MNQKFKAKLLLGTILISGLSLVASNFITTHAAGNEIESQSATEGFGNDDASTLPLDPTSRSMQIRSISPALIRLQRDFNSAIENGDISDMYRILGEMQASHYTPQLDGFGDDQWTLLHIASIAPRSRDVLSTLFLNTNAFVTEWARNHINDQDCYGRTALHWAAVKHNREAYDFLVLHGADTTLLDNRDRTPLEYFDRPMRYEENSINLI